MIGVVELSSADLSRMVRRVDSGAAHLRPLVEAIPCGVPLLIVHRRCPFRVPRPMAEGPACALIGDDLEDAQGPEAFHLPGVRKLLRAAAAVAIMCGAAQPAIYSAAPMIALSRRRPVVLIETQERREADWHDLAQKLAPRAAKLIVTPRPSGNA